MNKFSKIAIAITVVAVSGGLLMPAFADFTDDTGLADTAIAAGYNDNRTDLPKIIGQLSQSLMGLMGSIFLLLIIYAGVIWMTAQGSEEKIKKARGMISNAVTGLVLTIAAYSIVSFIVTKLIAAQNTAPATSASTTKGGPNTTKINSPNSPPAEVVPGLDGTDVFVSSDPTDPLGNLDP